MGFSEIAIDEGLRWRHKICRTDGTAFYRFFRLEAPESCLAWLRVVLMTSAVTDLFGLVQI